MVQVKTCHRTIKLPGTILLVILFIRIPINYDKITSSAASQITGCIFTSYQQLSANTYLLDTTIVYMFVLTKINI